MKKEESVRERKRERERERYASEKIIIFNLRETTLVYRIKERAIDYLCVIYTYIHIYIYYIYLSIIVQREYCSSDTTFNRVIEKWNKIKNLRGCEKLVRTRDCVNMFGSERKRKK